MTDATSVPADRHARLAGHVFTLLVLGAWAVWGLSVQSYQMPGPLDILRRLADFFTDWRELRHMFISFGHIIGAVALSFVVGSACAFLAFYLPRTRLMMHGRLTPFLNSFPGIGWIMLAIIWLGVNDLTVVFVISMVLVPFAILNMREGLDAIDAELMEMGNSFTRSRWRIFRTLVVPSLYPFVFATLRVSFGVAWKVALTAELFGGNTGFGYLLNLARNDFDTPLIFGIILIIIAFVYSTDRWVFVPVQRRLARHHGPA